MWEIDKQMILDLIIEAKRTDPETGSFTEWLAEYLAEHLSNLRPSNEWKGVPKLGVYDMACSKCGYSPGIRFYSSEFCPNCGAPMTDEAVEMVMERLEELNER